MINFKVIRWKNLLSTGNAFTEIKLNRSPSTLIVGENGGGKSTLLDALCFGLFGKPFRSINKPQLLNSINKKNLLVEIEFDIGGKDYKIIRGIKPHIFEIQSGGEVINRMLLLATIKSISKNQFSNLITSHSLRLLFWVQHRLLHSCSCHHLFVAKLLRTFLIFKSLRQ